MLSSIRKLVAGNGLAHALQLCSLFFFAKIYTPSDFGDLAQMQAISNILSIILTLQLHLTVPLCEDRATARERVHAIQSIVLVSSALMLIPAVFFQASIYWAVPYSLFLALINSYSGLLIFNGDFTKISIFYIARAVLVILFQLIFAVLDIRGGLLIGALLGEAVAALLIRYYAFGLRLNYKIEIIKCWLVIKRFSDFSVFGTVQEIVSVSAFYAPVMLFAYFFDQDTAGQYSMASKLIWAPVILVTRNVAQVLYHHLGKTREIDRSIIPKLLPNRYFLLIAICLCLLSFHLDWLYLFVLGPQWELASGFIPINLLWGAVFLFSTPFRVACRALKLQRYHLTVDFIVLLLILGTFAVLRESSVVVMWTVVAIAALQNLSIGLFVILKILSSNRGSSNAG